MKLFEFLFGFVFWIALIDFAANPKRALQEAYCASIAPSPRITEDGRMVIPKNPCKENESQRRSTRPKPHYQTL